MPEKTSPRATILELLNRLERASTQEDSGHLMARLTHPEHPLVVSFVNAHAVNLAAANADFAAHLLGSDYLLRDGSGVKIGCLVFDIDPGLNLNGTDLIPVLLSRYRGRRVALIGAEPYWLSRTLEKLKAESYAFSALTGLDGFQDERTYVELVRAHKPELIVLGMGMPHQERLAIALRSAMAEIGAPCVILNGGAIIDFMAGKFPRAPLWIRKSGIEWMFRLALEPRRLAKRYLLGNPVFLTRILLARLGGPAKTSPISRGP